ncbi:MAG: hypothetical protein LBJ18_01410 [Rickettsiales bacterium]|jgi:hypothetical protein|nr:hypothetical protein [Rickettsiales bacterium]
MNKQQAERRLAELFMDDLPLIEIAAKATPVSPDWFAKYKILRRDFLRSLSDSISELSFLTLSQDEFMGLIMGRALPANLTLRLRVPLVYGGKLEIDNMFLCRTFPHSYNMDRFVMEQAGAAELWLPSPVKKVYIPAHMLGGGEGGNATEDRLSQLAAGFAMAQAKGME